MKWRFKQDYDVELGCVKLKLKGDKCEENGKELLKEAVDEFNRYQKEIKILAEKNLHLQTLLEDLKAQNSVLERERKELIAMKSQKRTFSEREDDIDKIIVID